jgi:hypothetical protein
MRWTDSGCIVGIGQRLAPAFGWPASFLVVHHINDHAIRISNKEPADAPRLIRQRVNDLKAKSDGLRMHRINVIDLNGHVRLWLGRSGLLHQRDLSGWIARRDERDNPIHVHSHVEAQELGVELSALVILWQVISGTTLLMLIVLLCVP